MSAEDLNLSLQLMRSVLFPLIHLPSLNYLNELLKNILMANEYINKYKSFDHNHL